MKVLLALALGAGLATAPAQDKKKDAKKKVELRIKGPRMVFAPPSADMDGGSATILLTARLEGDPENAEEYYCLSESWEWGDEERSRYDPDCEPYGPGVELTRNYSATHRFKGPGRYNIVLRLERGGKTILVARHSVTIQGG